VKNAEENLSFGDGALPEVPVMSQDEPAHPMRLREKRVTVR
jgi:hypothetical protein